MGEPPGDPDEVQEIGARLLGREDEEPSYEVSVREFRVYGRSDDLVEVEGDVREEFTAPYPEERLFLTFSNGVVVSVEYGGVGEWTVSELYSPEDVSVEIHPTGWEDAPVDYTEVAVVRGGPAVEWVVTGENVQRFEEAGDA